jgi:hypothetical protein
MVLWNAKEMLEREHREGRTSHSAANDDPHLQILWKCKVPPKVRVFWWRVSHDFRPCQANLHRKHIERLGTCTFCGMEEETTFHSLTQCEFAISFCDKFRALTGIKLPKLCPRTWTRDLLDSWRTLSAVKKIGVSSCAACGHYGEVGMITGTQSDPGCV